MSGFPKREVATTSGAVSVNTGSTTVLGNNPSRQEVTITNDGANVVYLMFNKVRPTTTGGAQTQPTAVVGSGIRLAASGGSWTSTTYTGPISGIAVTAATSVTVAEF